MAAEDKPTLFDRLEDADPSELDVEYTEIADVEADARLVVKETKKGYKTTEFWLTILGSLAVVFNGVPLPESKEGYVVAALVGLYAVARGLAKKGIPDVRPVDAL